MTKIKKIKKSKKTDKNQPEANTKDQSPPAENTIEEEENAQPPAKKPKRVKDKTKAKAKKAASDKQHETVGQNKALR